jgi:hypothetical protein
MRDAYIYIYIYANPFRRVNILSTARAHPGPESYTDCLFNRAVVGTSHKVMNNTIPVNIVTTRKKIWMDTVVA